MIDKKEIEYISKLSRIELTPQLLETLSEDLKKIIEYIDTLKELDLEDVEPTTHAIELRNVFREDTPHQSLDREKILKIAPKRKEGFFKVPKVIE